MQGYRECRAQRCRGAELMSTGGRQCRGRGSAEGTEVQGVQRVQGHTDARGAEGTHGTGVQGVLGHRGPGVPGYHWLSQATIDLVGDNREYEV